MKTGAKGLGRWGGVWNEGKNQKHSEYALEIRSKECWFKRDMRTFFLSFQFPPFGLTKVLCYAHSTGLTWHTRYSVPRGRETMTEKDWGRPVFLQGKGNTYPRKKEDRDEGKENWQRCKEEAVRHVQWKLRAALDVKGGARETQAGGADLHCLCHSHSPQGAIERLERRKSKLRWTLSIKYTADFEDLF